MSRLKAENLKQCVSLIKDCIDGSPTDQKKEFAILALNQLQKITAGIGSSLDEGPTGGGGCNNGRPRADGSPFA